MRLSRPAWLALVLACAALRTAAATAQNATTAARIDSIIRHEMKQRRIPGVAAAVVENGRVVYRGAHGSANLELGTPLQPDFVFELASVTKPFTAAAILLLVQDGKLGLDDPISRYIDNTPATWSAITVRHLLSHTAGLNAAGLPRLDGSALLTVSTRQAFDFIAKQPMRSPPRQEGWYSDGGYFLLGMIIEKASGLSYRQFMQQRFFDPLQMTSSSILDRARVLKGRVSTYVVQNGELLNWRRDWDFEVPSFFGIFSTLDDMAKWANVLRGETLLRQSSLNEMWTPVKLNSGQLSRVLDRPYGLGFELADLRGAGKIGRLEFSPYN